MYKAYSISIEDDFYKECEVIEEKKKDVKININNFTNDTGDVITKDLIDLWFPSADFDIFLSHSHEDKDLAIRFSKYMSDNFGLRTFVDFQIWSHSDTLLKMFDDQFCRDKPGDNYSYALRNITTTHVYNMLSVALTKMMDKCQCVFFLNTKNSIKNDTPALQTGKKFQDIDIKRTQETYSSWIYMEISNLATLRKMSPEQISMESIDESIKDHVLASIKKFPNFLFDIHEQINFLPVINSEILELWKCEFNSIEYRLPQIALDILYERVEMNFDKIKT